MFRPFLFETQKNQFFNPRGKIVFLHWNLSPNFEIPEPCQKYTFWKLDFMRIISLLRRFHSRPRKPSSKPMKSFKLWTPIPSIYISPIFLLFSPPSSPNENGVAGLTAELHSSPSLLLFSSKPTPNSTKLKIDHRHSTPCNESFLLAPFSRRFVTNDLSNSH